MLTFGKKIQDRVAMLVPLLVFAGYFKTTGIALSRWYTDLTFLVLVAILSVQWTRINWKYSIPIRPFNAVSVIIIPWLILICFSIFISGTNEHSSEKILSFFIIVAPTTIAAALAVKTEKDFQYVGMGLLLLGVYAGLHATIANVFRIGPPTKILFAGSLTALGGLAAVQKLLNPREKSVFYLVCFCICTIGVVNSYARGQQLTYLFFLSAMLLIHFFSTRTGLFKKITFLILLAAVAGAAVINYQIFLKRQEDILWRFRREHIVNSLGVRGQLFAHAWNQFAKNPITGAGVGAYYMEIGPLKYAYPHNIPLEAAAEFGVFGLIFYFSLVSGAFAGYLLNIQKHGSIRENFIFYLFILIASFKQGALYGSKMFWVWTAIGVALIGRSSPLELTEHQADSVGKEKIHDLKRGTV